VKWGKWLDYFLGGISCSAMVISSGARGLLTNVQAPIILSLPFDLGLATATNQMRIAVNETGHTSAAPQTSNSLRFPQRASAANG
jgi:hypothetical protein